MTFRAETGDRISKFDIGRQDIQSDTGVLSADFQTAIGKMNGFLRVARRNNVTSASRAGSYTQRDVSGQFFLRLTQSTQIFGLATATRTTDEAGGGNTYWQAGGGTQMQLVAKGLWLRTEGTISRNADLLTRSFVPRESLSVGVNGHIAQRTTVGIDVYLDRAALINNDASPWATRSLVRVTQSLSTGSPFAPPTSSGLFRTVPARAFATVKGMVYADWNGNGLQDPGENPVAHVPLRIEASGAVETGKDGEFIFRNVPDGMHDVAIDAGSLPIDFDAPRIPRVQVALSGKDTKEVAFGLIPLGRIHGAVVRDLNGNGIADAGEPSMDDAIVVLDDGNRSERSKRGTFAFEAVQSGEHSVTLLTDSLPEGAVISGATDSGSHTRPRSHGDRAAVSRVGDEARGGQKGIRRQGACGAAGSGRRPAARWRRAKTRRRDRRDDGRRAPATIVSARKRPRFHATDRRVRRSAARQEDGRRADGDGIRGLCRRANGQQSERSVSRPCRQLRDARGRRACCGGGDEGRRSEALDHAGIGASARRDQRSCRESATGMS